MTNFNLQIRHRKKLTITINRSITIYCKKLFYNFSLSRYLIIQIQCLFPLNQALMHCGCNFCCLRCDSRTNMNFFFLFHNFTNRGFILTIDLGNFSIQFFFFALFSPKTFNFSLKGSSVQFLLSICKLPASHTLALWGC